MYFSEEIHVYERDSRFMYFDSKGLHCFYADAREHEILQSIFNNNITCSKEEHDAMIAFLYEAKFATDEPDHGIPSMYGMAAHPFELYMHLTTDCNLKCR